MSNTQTKHVSYDKALLEDAREIAQRQGRSVEDIMRESLARFIEQEQGDQIERIHSKVPHDARVFAGDAAHTLDFTYTREKHDGAEIHGLEPSGRYFDYYRFNFNNSRDLWVCNKSFRMSVEMLEWVHEVMKEEELVL